MQNPGELRKFVAPEYVFGIGARHMAGQYASNLGGRKVLVVTDPGVVAAGWTQDVLASLKKAGLRYAMFTAVSPNPRVAEVMAGAEIYREEGCNALVAVGGGSPMDCAKGIGIVSTSQRHILEFEGVDQVSHPIPPLICIPTTGGTAADLSQFAIISNPGEAIKFAVVSKAVVPDVALVDPVTLTTMDSYLAACTGLDALTHGIEAFLSTASSQLTDLHAVEAIHLISENLVLSIRSPLDLELRTKVMLGSLHAGLAFSNAILGANHAMAHSLGGYFDLPHGESNAILLDHVLEFNFTSAPERCERIARIMGVDLRGLSARQRQAALGARIRTLKEAVGLDRTLGELGVKAGDIPPLSRQAMHDPCLVTNPRRPVQRDIEALYEEAL